MKIIRSYKKLVNEIINLPTTFRTEILDYVQYKEIYPIFLIKHLSKGATKRILILSGHHGDEYYCVHILLKWLLQFKFEDFKDYDFYIYPCINPSGYSTGSRENSARQDTNNDKAFVKDSQVKELAILFDSVPSDINLYLDIHADTGKSGCYCYENKPEGEPSIATPALIENDIILPYAREKTIYKMKVKTGIVSPPDYDIGIEKVMEIIGVNYTLGLELPGKCSGQKRAAGGIAIINSILRHFKITTVPEQKG